MVLRLHWSPLCYVGVNLFNLFYVLPSHQVGCFKSCCCTPAGCSFVLKTLLIRLTFLPLCHLLKFVRFLFCSSMRVVGCCRFFIPQGVYWGQIQFYSGQGTTEWVASSCWWQRLPHRVPTAHQELFWGSVSCSRILWHVAQSHPRGVRDSNQRPSDHWSTSSTHWATPLVKVNIKYI